MGENLSSITDSVLIPTSQAIITGGLTCVFVESASILAGAPHPVAIAITAGAGVALLSWLRYRAHYMSLLERFLRLETPSPAPATEYVPAPVKVLLQSPDGMRGDYIDLPARPDQLRRLADGLQDGRQFAQSVWTGNGAPFSRAEFENLRAELIRRNLAKWRKEGAPGQGVELLSAGRVVLRHFASDARTPSPTLIRDDRRE